MQHCCQKYIYNIPARRKFLKSDNVEYRQIISEFIRVALTRTDIEFKFIHNSKDIYHLSPTSNLKQRIAQVLGKDIAKDLIDLQTDTTVVSLRGYVGRPSLAKKNQPNQYLFVNGRFFKSPMMHKAVLKAYNNLIPDGTVPSYFIYLEIDPANMDVNIHPTKTEIKFEDDTVIFEILHAAVKEAIGEGAFIPMIDFDTEGAPEIPVLSPETKYVAPPKINYDPLFNPFNEELASRRGRNSEFTFNEFAESLENSNQTSETQIRQSGEANHYEERSYFREQNSYGGIFNDETASGERPILQLKGKYIVTPVKSGLLLVDIKRAQERILYEQYLNTITAGTISIQENLYPQTVDLDHSSFSLLMEHDALLKGLGFDIRPFGNDCVVVYGFPAVLSETGIDANDCIDTLLANLQVEGADLNREMKEGIALALARSGSGRLADSITHTQAQGIVDNLFACKEPHIPLGPSGKCMTIITLEDLAKKLL